MFYQLQSEFLRSMLTFAIKMQYGMVHNRKKKKEKKKDKSIMNLKEFGKLMNHSKNYNNHQKSCNSGLFWKERKCVCMLAYVWPWVSSGYVCVFYVGFMYMRECYSMKLGIEATGYEIFCRITPSTGWSWKWKKEGN